jgi:hypothetical protein
MNFDAANIEGFSTQAAVCRNSNGEIIKILTHISPPCSPVYGEALAAKLAGVLAYSLHLDKFILEGDYALVVLVLQNPALSVAWHIEQIIHDTLASFQVSSLWEARKINKSVNFCVHYVAYRVAARVIPGCIPFPPSSIPICSRKDLPPLYPP